MTVAVSPSISTAEGSTLTLPTDEPISKYTDFPRLALVRSIFPNSRFVHIRRDAHAVANSYAVEIETGRFGTWAQREWWSAQWPSAAREHWQATGETVLGFAAHNRNRLVSLIDDAVAGDAGVLGITYEALAEDPDAQKLGRAVFGLVFVGLLLTAGRHPIRGDSD